MKARVEIIRREPLSAGFLRLVRYQLDVPVPGTDSRETVYRECIEGLGSAAVLPFDPVSGRIVLVEQFRVGALGSGRGLLLEPPGGVIEAGQTPEEAARREAWEEAGCRIGAIANIGICRTCPGFSDETVALFCGETDASNLARVAGNRAEGECTHVVVWELDRALRDLGQGPWSAASLMLTVQWLALNRWRIRELWGAPAGDPAPTAGLL